MYGGGPVGIEAVAATINDDAETLSEIVEPYLLKIGFVAREPRGRRVTREAYAHLGKLPPQMNTPRKLRPRWIPSGPPRRYGHRPFPASSCWRR